MPDSSAAGASRERLWTSSALGVVALAVVVRIHNAFAYPALHDFDAAAHVQSVFALYDGRLPDPRTWAGFHPPLYYALGAAIWHALPDTIPVHAALRLLSAAAGFAALAITWRTLRSFVSPADAAITAAVVASAPVFAIATSMLGNETLCALFATAALARLCALPDEPERLARHALGTGVLAGLAALAKSTGLVVVATVVATYLVRARRAGAPAVRAAIFAATTAALLCLPFLVWLTVETGSPLAAISGGKPSDAAGSEMAAQPPGERHLADYVSLPPAAVLAPWKEAPGMVGSVPGLLYATTWADGQGQFLPVEVSRVRGAAMLAAITGLLPTLLAIAGLVRIALRPGSFRSVLPCVACGALLFAVFLVQTWLVPRYSAVKASYLLAAMLPAALALAAGLRSVSGGLRAVLRAALVASALYATLLTRWGWWS